MTQTTTTDVLTARNRPALDRVRDATEDDMRHVLYYLSGYDPGTFDKIMDYGQTCWTTKDET